MPTGVRIASEHAPGDAMVDVNELGFDLAETYAIGRFDRSGTSPPRGCGGLASWHLISAIESPVPDDRHVEFPEKVGYAADVIFVPMSHEHRAKLLGPVTDVAEVIDDHVDAEHFVVGKHQTAIDRDEIVVGLDDGHVPADLAASADRDDAKIRLFGRIRNKKFFRPALVRGGLHQRA